MYACQDEGFDRAHGLRSIPALLGAQRALWVSRGFHALAIGLFVAFGRAAGLGPAFASGVAAAGLLLVWQHWLLRRGDLTRIQTAFFTANGILSVVMLAAGCFDLYLFV
jgi:4-hydroxybenzoate polyprenyltransferase